MKLIGILILSFLALGCNDIKQQETASNEMVAPVQVSLKDGLQRAYFSSGCFWCVEEIYENVKGVKESISGYAGGSMQNPTYRNHGNHAEANEIIYDPEVVSFATLVDVYFASQNIEQVNGQGPDIGKAYRSIIFYQNDEQKKIIDDKIAQLNTEGYDVAASVEPFQKFWVGEDYHQDYAKLNPNQPYIQGVSIPRFKRFAAKMPEVLKANVKH